MRSVFLKTLIDNCGVLNTDRKERLEKLKGRLGKVCQYLGGISPHQESQATTPNLSPLGYGRFRWNQGGSIRPLR